MVFDAESRVLWAGDYVQNAREPELYTAAVVRSARLRGLSPERVVAQHLAPMPWVTIEALADRVPGGAGR